MSEETLSAYHGNALGRLWEFVAKHTAPEHHSFDVATEFRDLVRELYEEGRRAGFNHGYVAGLQWASVNDVNLKGVAKQLRDELEKNGWESIDLFEQGRRAGKKEAHNLIADRWEAARPLLTRYAGLIRDESPLTEAEGFCIGSRYHETYEEGRRAGAAEEREAIAVLVTIGCERALDAVPQRDLLMAAAVIRARGGTP